MNSATILLQYLQKWLVNFQILIAFILFLQASSVQVKTDLALLTLYYKVDLNSHRTFVLNMGVSNFP